MHQTSPSKRLPEEESGRSLWRGKGGRTFFWKSCHFAMLYFPPADIPSTVSIPTLCLWCQPPQTLRQRNGDVLPFSTNDFPDVLLSIQCRFDSRQQVAHRNVCDMAAVERQGDLAANGVVAALAVVGGLARGGGIGVLLNPSVDEVHEPIAGMPAWA